MNLFAQIRARNKGNFCGIASPRLASPRFVRFLLRFASPRGKISCHLASPRFVRFLLRFASPRHEKNESDKNIPKDLVFDIFKDRNVVNTHLEYIFMFSLPFWISQNPTKKKDSLRKIYAVALRSDYLQIASLRLTSASIRFVRLSENPALPRFASSQTKRSEAPRRSFVSDSGADPIISFFT